MSLGSVIRNPGYGKNLFRIQGSKDRGPRIRIRNTGRMHSCVGYRYLGSGNPPPFVLLLPLLVVDEVVKDGGGVLEHVQGLQHHPALVRENLLHNQSINQLP
jgi:hypothetical protein